MKKFMEVLEEELGFVRAKIDPCLLYRTTAEGTVLLLCYVDDGCLYGSQAAIDKAKNDLEKKFNIKKVGNLQKYIGVTVNKMEDGALTLSKPDIMAKLKRYFI